MNLTSYIILFWESWAQSPVAARLTLTLLHFLWQGAAFGAAAFLLLAALKRTTPQVRYVALLTLIALMPISTIITWIVIGTDTGPMTARRVAVVEPNSRQSASVQTVVQSAVAPITARHEVGGPQEPVAATVRPTPTMPASEEHTNASNTASRFLGAVTQSLMLGRPWIATAWLLGVFLFGMRLAIGLAANERVCRRGLMPVGESIEEMVAALRERMGIRRTVRVFESCLAETPALVGWFAPVILLPLSALCELPPLQLQAILAHELAHVRRHDYLANLLQTVVETFLYYHPAVWWISRQIRIEREHCCDDMAVDLCGDCVAYARALASLEELRAASPHYAVAANTSPLAARIRRVIDRSRSSENDRPALPALLMAAILVIGVTTFFRHDVRASGSVEQKDEQGNRPVPTVEPRAQQKPAGPMTRIAGRIVDQVGTPLAGAYVCWEVNHQSNIYADPELLVDGTTDGAGRFDFKRPAKGIPHGQQFVWVQAPGKRLAILLASDGLVVNGKAPNWIIRLQTARDVSFLVVDQDGKPIAGARIQPHRFLGRMARS